MVLMGLIKPIVDSQFEKASLGLGFVFFLLPFILLAGISMFIGTGVNAIELLLAITKELVFWILASVVLFILLIAFKGKEANGKFKNVMAAFSSIYLVSFALSFLSYLLVYIFIPGFFQKILSLKAKSPNFDEIVSSIGSMALPSQEILILLFVLLLGIGIVAVLLGLYVIYRTGTLVRKTSAFSNSVFVIVFLGLAFLLVSGVSLIFSLF